MALSPTGFVAKTANEWLEQFRSELRSSPFFGPFVNLRPASRLGTMIGIVSEMAGEVSENQQALYDSRSRDNAVGQALDNLAGVISIRRRPATRSTAFVRFYGTGPVPAGSIVEMSSTGDRFVVLVGVAAISGAGFSTLTVRAEGYGPMTIGVGDIDTLVTPLPGVTSVENTSAGFSGANLETDAELRLRMANNTESGGSGTVDAIKSALDQSIPDGSFTVLENDTSADIVDPSGYVLLAYGIGVIAYPPTLDTALLAETIWLKRGAGTPTSGTESDVVVDSMGFTHDMFFEWAEEVALEVEVDLSGDAAEGGFPTSTAEATVKETITSYTASRSVGQKFRPFEAVVLVDEALPEANDVVVRVRRKGSGDPFQTSPLALGLAEKVLIEDAADISYTPPP